LPRDFGGIDRSLQNIRILLENSYKNIVRELHWGIGDSVLKICFGNEIDPTRDRRIILLK